MRSFWALLLIVIGSLLSRSASAAEAGEELTISLLTMGPGEHPFTKFGHSAIWVHDRTNERDEVYNYGTFAFDSPTALLDSVAGKLPYWLSVQSLGGTLRTYREQGRSLVASELELTPIERTTLFRALRENARPEQRYYRYDYFRDNCSTRVRDVFDRVIGGQIRAQTGHEAGRLSYRSHMLRLVADQPLLYIGLDLAVGRLADVPVTFWDEGWLPERLHDLLTRTRVTRDGRELPLIRNERVLLATQVGTPKAEPPDLRARYWALGLALGTFFVALGLANSGRAAVNATLGIAYLAVGGLGGLLGCMLCYLTFFSAHSAAAANYNVLLLPPWLLALAAAGVRVLRDKPNAWKLARFAANGAALSSALALLLHLLMRNAQANAQELGVALPLWFGLALSARQPRWLLGAAGREKLELAPKLPGPQG